MTLTNEYWATLAPFGGPCRGVFLLIASLVFSTPCFAQTCTPPSQDHPTLQQAIDDPGCVTVSLQAQAYWESILISRSLNLEGTGLNSSTVDGPITVTGTTTQVNLSEVSVRNGCTVPGINIIGGAQVHTSNVAIETAAIACPEMPGLLFKDSFEGS